MAAERGLYLRGGIWHMTIGVHGKTTRKTTGTKNLAEARAYRRAYVEKLVRAKGKSGHRLTITDGVDGIVIKTYRVAGKLASAERASDALKHIQRHFGAKRKMATIAHEDLLHYVESRRGEGAKLGTIAYELQTLRRAFKLAALNYALPVPTFPSIDPQNARQGFLEEYEVRKILDLLPEPTRLLVRFLSISGWRSSEAKNLTWDRVDWRNGEVVLYKGQTKNDEGRVLPFDEMPELRAVLARCLELRVQAERLNNHTRPVLHVFHREGRPIKHFIAAFKSAAKAIGRPGAVPHDLRRSVVRQLVWARVPHQVAKAITGHKSDTVFRRYDIVDRTALKAGMRGLRDFRAKLTEGMAAPDVLHSSLHSPGVLQETQDVEVREKIR